jgi:hypothetical protein
VLVDKGMDVFFQKDYKVVEPLDDALQADPARQGEHSRNLVFSELVQVRVLNVKPLMRESSQSFPSASLFTLLDF